MITVFGIGSDSALDRIGWQIMEPLSHRFASALMVFHGLRDPVELATRLPDVEHAVLIDACNRPFGEVAWVTPAELHVSRSLSSHALPLPDLLAMAYALNPGLRCDIIGLGIEGGESDQKRLLSLVLPELEALLRTLVEAE